MRLCLRNLPTVSQPSHCFSRHHRHSSPPWLDYRETQLTSESTTSFPMFQPNDTIWVRWVGKGTRTWKGPYTVILSTPTAVKRAGILPWMLHTQVKKAEAADAAKWSLWITNPLKVSLGPKVLPLHHPQTPPESDIWNEYRIMLQPPQHLGLNLGTKIDRHREGMT